MRLRPSAALAAVALSLVLPGALAAQDRTPESVLRSTGRAIPGSYNSSPTAYGTAGGDLWFGAEYETVARFSETRPDGNVSFGFGLFNASNIAGLEVSLTSLTTVNGFGDQLVGNFKIHKLLGGDLGIAVGMEGIKLSDNDASDKLRDPSFYAAVNKGFKFEGRSMFNEVTIGAGVGNGRFQDWEEYLAEEDGVGFFINSSIRANNWASFALDYVSTNDLSLAARLQPPGELPLTISPTLYFRNISEDPAAKVRYGLSATLVLW